MNTFAKNIALFMALAFLLLGCEEINTVNNLKVKPCQSENGSEIADPKANFNKPQNGDLEQHWAYETDLVVKIGDEFVDIGRIWVVNSCDFIYVNYEIDKDCWKFLGVKVWIGKHLVNLENIGGSPDQFPDAEIFHFGLPDTELMLAIPYQEDFFCEDQLIISAYADVENVCDCPGGSQTATGKLTVQKVWILAGQHINSGYAQIGYEITDDALYLTIDFDLFGSVKIDDWHAEVVKDFNELPINNGGNLSHGSMEFSGNGPVAHISIPLDKDEFCESYAIVVIHLALSNGETAWLALNKDDYQIPGVKKWAYYFNITFPSCDIPEEECEYPAWGSGYNLFQDLDNLAQYFQYEIYCGQDLN